MATKENEVRKPGEVGKLLKAVEIVVSDVSQTIKVMDLKTGNEEFGLVVKQSKFAAPVYSVEEYGGTPELFEEALFAAACQLVSPRPKQIDALLYRATQESYQSGKSAALATGEFCTQDLKQKIVQVMRGNAHYVENSASECFSKWKAGFAAKKPGALKILDLAKSFGDFGDLE